MPWCRRWGKWSDKSPSKWSDQPRNRPYGFWDIWEVILRLSILYGGLGALGGEIQNFFTPKSGTQYQNRTERSFTSQHLPRLPTGLLLGKPPLLLGRSVIQESKGLGGENRHLPTGVIESKGESGVLGDLGGDFRNHYTCAHAHARTRIKGVLDFTSQSSQNRDFCNSCAGLAWEVTGFHLPNSGILAGLSSTTARG